MQRLYISDLFPDYFNSDRRSWRTVLQFLLSTAEALGCQVELIGWVADWVVDWLGDYK